MKLDWQWPAALVFSVVFLTMGVLVYAGKIPAPTLIALLTWLIPSPIVTRRGLIEDAPQGSGPGQTNSLGH